MNLSVKLLAAAVIGIASSGCNEHPPDPTKVQATSTPAHAPASATSAVKVADVWSYNSYSDSMTGMSSSYATTLSTNTASLEFPYQGSQHAKLTITEDDTVHVSVEKGQITCPDSCKILVKFDGESKAAEYIWHGIGDKSDRVASWDKKLSKRIHRQNHLTVRLDFFQNNPVDFEFEIFGLKPFAISLKKNS